MSNNLSELYLPATDSELRSYVSRLNRIVGKFTLNDGWHVSLSLKRDVTLDDSSVRAVAFEVYSDDDTHVYEVVMAERIPINALWDQSVVSSLLGDEYIGLNVSQIEAISDLKEEHEISEEGFTEGYLERERMLKVYKGYRSIAAMMAFNMNVMDDNFNYIDCEVGYSPGVFDDEESSNIEIERLIRFGELLLDTTTAEQKQSEVTRADLIIATNALKGAGIAHSSMRAFRNAPLDFNGSDFFSIHGG